MPDQSTNNNIFEWHDESMMSSRQSRISAYADPFRQEDLRWKRPPQNKLVKDGLFTRIARATNRFVVKATTKISDAVKSSIY